jgi:hypothetical protein
LIPVAKLVLDTMAMLEDFFEDTAMIGIVTAQPAYRFCWMLNNYFDINFIRDPEQNLALQKKDKEKKENEYKFPIYCYGLPNCYHEYRLYKLKNGAESLLPETKQMDYLWLLKTANPKADAHFIINELKNIADVQLAQLLAADQLKSINNLLV